MRVMSSVVTSDDCSTDYPSRSVPRSRNLMMAEFFENPALYGDATTQLGFVGVIATFFILVWIFRAFSANNN